MRFREFSRKRNHDHQVDEVVPSTGTFSLGNQPKAVFTQQGMQRQMGNKLGQAATGQKTTPPVQIKPGVKILHPGLGATKIKSIQGKDAVLDTQKALGQDIRVDQNELLAVLGQGQPEDQEQQKKLGQTQQIQQVPK